MKFTPEVRTAILAYLAGDGETPKGQACRFIPMEEFGVKLYGRNEESAKSSYVEQTSAYAKGVAPAVGDYFRIRLRLGPKEEFSVFGYLTEMATGIGEVFDAEDYYMSATYQELCSRMADAGYSTGDLHGGNFGWVGGKLVCIDFDAVSLSCF